MPHLIGQSRIEGDTAIGRKLDKALRQIIVAGGKRRADFALGDAPVEDAIERPVADLDRIVVAHESGAGVNAATDKREGRCGKENRARKRNRGMAQHGNESFSAQGVNHGANIAFAMARRIARHLRLFDNDATMAS
ncbi:MAG TPA: hypothetical protein VNZ48_09750 [Xanthobacteraceae bacterium]|nr:hypothetical protein [Xanthobacteraceae bacterium]